MAGDWIKMRNDLAEDPAVIAIAAQLGMDEHTIVGKLHCLWSWADRHTTTGNAVAVNCIWIDKFVRAELFSNALISQGWLCVTGDTISFPKFTRHNGKSSKQRALTAKRVAKNRAKNSNAKRNAADVTKTLPEKSRVEKNNTPKAPKGVLWFPVTVGTCLDVPDFKAAWVEWQQHRCEIRKKLTATAAKQQLDRLAGWGVPRAIAAIRLSIAQSWEGIYEEKGINGKPLPGPKSEVGYWIDEPKLGART